MKEGKELCVNFGAITQDNVEQLRKVNTACFPVSYNDGFYLDVVKEKDSNLCKFAYLNGFVIGAICARIEPILASPNGNCNSRNSNNSKCNSNRGNSTNESNGSAKPQNQGKKRVYIMTLGVLAAYRGRGVGRKLVQSLLDYCYEHTADSPSSVSLSDHEGEDDGTGNMKGAGNDSTDSRSDDNSNDDDNDSVRSPSNRWNGMDENVRNVRCRREERDCKRVSTTGPTSEKDANWISMERKKELAQVEEIMLHVQTSNVDAMKFYMEGFGFEKGEMMKNYYRRIDPPHCYVLRKRL